MKKLFTLFAAVLLATGLWAVDTKTYSFASADELTNFTYTAGDASDTWAVCTSKTNNIDVRDGGFVQYKNAKSNTTATFVTKESFTKISNISFYIASTDKGKTNVKIEVSPKADFSSDVTEIVNASGLSGLGISSPANTTWYSVSQTVASKSGYIRFSMSASSSGKFWSFDDIIITYSSCDDPHSSLSADPVSAFVNDEVELLFSSDIAGDPNWSVKKDGVAAEEGVDYTMGDARFHGLVAGEFEITATQDADGTYCAVEESVTVTVNAKTPVTAVSVAGPAEGFVGAELVYTATAANATQFEWYLDGAKQGSDSAKFIFTPAADKTYSIVCKARNEFNAAEEWIASETKTVKVTKNYVPTVVFDWTKGEGAQITEDNTNLNANKMGSMTVGTSVVARKLGENNIDNNNAGYKFGNDDVCIEIQGTSDFIAGDTVKVSAYGGGSGERGIAIASSSVTSASSENVILTNTLNGKVNGECVAVITETQAGAKLRVFRQAGKSMYVKGIKVIRPAQKEIISADTTLTAVSVNDVAISEANLATLLANPYTLALEDEFVVAPVVKFTQHSVVVYEGDEEVVKDKVIAVTASENAGKWQAQATIAGKTYTVTAVKSTSFKVAYFDGATKLGEEAVKAGEKAANYANYQLQQLKVFEGWFAEVELQNAVDLSTFVINADLNVYGKWGKAYAKSINIEQIVLDEGTQFNIKDELIEKGYGYSNIDALDTLNDLENKPNRNYDFLGLKLKKSGAKLTCNIKAGDTITVLFGNLPDSIKVGVNSNYQKMKVKNLGRRAAADEFLEIITTTDKTVVLKQIMINEEVVEVALPEPGAYLVKVDTTILNGKLVANWANKKYRAPVGATVTLTATPDEGYVVSDVKVDGISLNAVEGVYSFEMPAKDVEVTATFETEATAIVNTDAAAKAVKVVRDGQLLIIKNGRTYNVLGADVE